MATSTTSTLRMTFNLDNGKTKTVNLADPRDDVASADVSGFMDDAVTRRAMLVGTARLASKKSACVRTVTDNVLF